MFAQSWCQNDLQSLPLKTLTPESQAAVCTVIYVWVESTFSHAERDKGTSLQNTECVCVCEREAQNCFLSIPAGIHGPGIQTTTTCLCDGPTALQSSLNIAPISSHLQTVDFSFLSHCLEVLLYNSWQNSPNLSQESAKLEKLRHYCLWISTKLLSTLYAQPVLEILNTPLSSTSLSPTINLLNIPCLKPYSIQNKNVVWNES